MTISASSMASSMRMVTSRPLSERSGRYFSFTSWVMMEA